MFIVFKGNQRQKAMYSGSLIRFLFEKSFLRTYLNLYFPGLFLKLKDFPFV
jgi:hypothetical protein